MTDRSQFGFHALTACERDIGRLQSLFTANGMDRSVAELRWRYLESPTRRMVVHIAVDTRNDCTAAAYCVFPVQVQLHGRSVLAAQSLDTVTDHRYRGLGLFKTLARSVYEACRQQDVRFVYGFPNDQSGPGFFGRLGWEQHDPVPFMVRPIRMSYFFRRLGLQSLGRVRPRHRSKSRSLLASFDCRPVSDLSLQVESLWERIAPTISVGVVRNLEYLRWRYIRNPSFQYEIRELYDRDQLVALGVYRVAEKHGGRIGYLMELLVKPGYESTRGPFARRLVQEMSEDGAEIALAWQIETGPYRAALWSAGFVPLPERARPIHLHFGWVPTGERERGMHRSDWFLSYSDSDTV